MARQEGQWLRYIATTYNQAFRGWVRKSYQDVAVQDAIKKCIKSYRVFRIVWFTGWS